MLQRPKGLKPQSCRSSTSTVVCYRRGTVSSSIRQPMQGTNRVVSCRAVSGSDSTGSSSSGQPSVSVADPQPPNNASGPDRSALLARVAAAKAAAQAYKSGGSSTPEATSASTSTDAQQEQDTTLSEEQQEAMRQQYLQQLQQQQQELAAQNSAYTSFLQSSTSNSSSSGSSALDRLAAEDPGWGPGSQEGPARGDFYTSADAPEVQQLLQSAPKRSGTGSADEAADWLKGVMQDRGTQVQAFVHASVCFEAVPSFAGPCRLAAGMLHMYKLC